MTVAIPASLPSTPDARGLGGLAALIDRAEVPLPLASVRVRATIAGNVCRTVVDQVFWNSIDRPVEAILIFPLPERGAVVGMELHAGDLVVRGDLRSRATAEAEFAAARTAGRRAALLTAERADVHTLRVTMLPPREEIRVRIELVEELALVDGALRWRFPTTVAPRFTPGTPIGHSGPGAVPDTDQAPDASRLQPPLRLEGGTRLDLEVKLEGAVRSIASSLHALRFDLEDGVRVAPSGEATLDRDFVIAFRLGEGLGTRAWTDGTHTLVLVEPPAIPGDVLPRDAVFVVDISGSMGGEKMVAAKKALSAALHGLLPQDRFQIIAFDDRVERFAPALVAYDDRTLEKADAWVARLAARGGTVMLPALQAAFEGETPEGRSRTVLFITDGQATDDQQLVACVRARAGRTRLFTLGIDTAVNAALLSQLARIGGGDCALATPRDDIEALITRVEARFGAPIVDELRIDGVTTASMQSEALFAGRPAALSFEGAPMQVEVRGSRDFHVTVVPERSTAPIATLWARARIAMLEDRLAERPWEGEAIGAEIERLALRHHLASTRTAWIAVEQTRTVDGTPVEVLQPAELPDGWVDGGSGGEPNLLQRPASPGASMAQPIVAAPAMAKRAAVPRPPPALAPAAPQRLAAKVDRWMDRARGGITGAFGGARDQAPTVSESSAAHETMDFMEAEPPPGRARRAEKELKKEALAGDAGGFAYPSAPAPEPMVLREPAPDLDPAGTLARRQGADGSFGGSVPRTVAALLALVLLGHTRRSGLRMRAVQKAAAWLTARASEPLVALALSTLEAAEAGTEVTPTDAWAPLRALPDAEGIALMMALRDRAR